MAFCDKYNLCMQKHLEALSFFSPKHLATASPDVSSHDARPSPSWEQSSRKDSSPSKHCRELRNSGPASSLRSAADISLAPAIHVQHMNMWRLIVKHSSPVELNPFSCLQNTSASIVSKKLSLQTEPQALLIHIWRIPCLQCSSSLSM